MGLRIVVACHHAIVCAGLRSVLQEHDDMEIIAEANEARAAIRLAKELRPNVVLMDLAMPDLNGIDATRRIASGGGPTGVLAMSPRFDRAYVGEALSAGAMGYLVMNCAVAELAVAVRTVAKGQVYLSPGVAQVVVETYVRGNGNGNGHGDSHASVFGVLTVREREVLQLLAEGKTNKAIAMSLHISSKTVETHRAQIMNKLDIRTVAELTKYAIRQGLTVLEA
jgi:DNA-binding NarL/FixJ family response regulator